MGTSIIENSQDNGVRMTIQSILLMTSSMSVQTLLTIAEVELGSCSRCNFLFI